MATTLLGMSSGIWGVIFYLYLNLGEIGFQPDFIGNMFTASAVATGLVALPAGLLCERVGTKRAMLVSQASSFASIIQIVTLHPSILLLASLITGLVGTIAWVASAPFMMENSQPEERTYLFSISWAAMVIMGVIGSYVGGAMPDTLNAALGLPVGVETGSAAGYRIALVISIALALAVTVPILFIKEDKTVQRQKAGALLSLKNIKSPLTIIKLMIPTGLIGFGAGFIVPLFSIFFKLKFAATPEEVGTIFALGNVTLGIGTLVAPTLSNKIGKVKAAIACQYFSMPFIMLMTLSPNLAMAASAYFVRGAFMNMAGPVSTTFQMEIVTENERATTSGLMVMSDNIPRAVTASISGKMMTGSDFYTPFLFTTATYFVASSLYFVFFRKAEGSKN
jgi:MFS family permease